MFAVFGLGPSEVVVLAIVAVLLFGNRLPEIAHSVGKAVKEFQGSLKEVEGDLAGSIRR